MRLGTIKKKKERKTYPRKRNTGAEYLWNFPVSSVKIMWPISKYLSNTFFCSVYHRAKQLILVYLDVNLLLITIPYSVALKGNSQWCSSPGFAQKSWPKIVAKLSVTGHLVQKPLCNTAQGHPLTLDVKTGTAENDWSSTMKWELYTICSTVKLTINIRSMEGVWYFKPLNHFSLGETLSQMC